METEDNDPLGDGVPIDKREHQPKSFWNKLDDLRAQQDGQPQKAGED